MSSSSEVVISDIDKERFGILTARVIGVTTGSLFSTLDFCRKELVKLLIARCSMFDLETAQALENEGFLLMDTLVYYALDLSRKPLPSDNSLVHFRPIHAGEEEEMRLVAIESFRGYYGHYHADPRLDKNKCDEAYIDWAMKACEARGSDENFLVAEIDGRIVAFGVFRMNNPDEGELFLGGVLPEFQGHGIYNSFLCRAMEWCLSKNARKIIISTQINNLAVQKVLTRFGFEIAKGYYTFHKWFD
jgi:RimJ/RimL family protein N-acetyltransferase